MFPFQISANSPYTYDNIYCTCSFIKLFLIFILIKSLHVVKKPKIFPISPLNVGGLATSIFDPVLGQGNTTTSSFPRPA